MFEPAEFINTNPVLMGFQLICSMIFFYGIYKESIKIVLFPVVALALVMFAASAFLHLYCKFTGTDIDTIESYDYAVIAAVFFWCLVAISILWCLNKFGEKLEDNELENVDIKK